jgi:hypothetical protein
MWRGPIEAMGWALEAVSTEGVMGLFAHWGAVFVAPTALALRLRARAKRARQQADNLSRLAGLKAIEQLSRRSFIVLYLAKSTLTCESGVP